MTPPVQISTQKRIAAYGFNGKVGSEQRLHKINRLDELLPWNWVPLVSVTQGQAA